MHFYRVKNFFAFILEEQVFGYVKKILCGLFTFKVEVKLVYVKTCSVVYLHLK